MTLKCHFQSKPFYDCMIFSESKHPQLLSFLSHEFLCKYIFTSRFPQLQTLVELCFGPMYTKPAINIQMLPWFLPSIFTLLCFPDVYILKSLVTLSDPGGSTDQCVKSQSSNEPSSTQWCMDVPIKSASYFLSLAAFLIRGGEGGGV